MHVVRSVLLPCFVGALMLGIGAGRAPSAESSRAAVAEDELLNRARQIHAQAITLDTHVDIAGAQYATAELDPGVDHPKLQCNLVKMVAGGVDGVFLAAYNAQGQRDAEGYRRADQVTREKILAIRRLATMYPDRCELATTPHAVERIVASGKRAIMIGVENGYPIGVDLTNVERFYALGVRYITLCHNGHNQLCDSCNPSQQLGDQAAEHQGLSPFGRQVVAEMNRLGMMIDTSHAARSSFRDVVAVSRAPVMASHSGCAAVHDHPRNLDDEQLKLLAANGGAIQIIPVAGFLKPPTPQRKQAVAELANSVGLAVTSGEVGLQGATQEQREQVEQRMAQIDRRYPAANLQDFINHIDHAVKVAGIDHVGIGSDFDGGGGIAGFNSHADALNVTVALLRRGYTAAAITKIWGGNLLRVWRAVEKAANARD